MTEAEYQDEVRSGLARAMGWTDPEEYPPGRLWMIPPGRDRNNRLNEESVPDPLHNAEDAEALWTWLEGSWVVSMSSGMGGCVVDAWGGFARGWQIGPVVVRAAEVPDPALRRRTALVMAAWQAVGP